MENLPYVSKLNNESDWLPDNVFNLDPFFADELLTNVADFGSQSSDLLSMDDVLGEFDSPMFNATATGNDNYDDNNNNDHQIYSSAASDSGLSSDNLDLDINNDMDLLSSCLPSPASDHSNESSPTPVAKACKRRAATAAEIVPPVLKRSARTNRNNSRYGSAAKQNNNAKKDDHKSMHIKSSNGNNKSRSIIVPVTSQNIHTIKIVNSGSAQLKSANIKAVAANLLQKSKQGLLQKNILIPKQEIDDLEEDMLNFEEIMQETDDVIAAHEDDNLDDDGEFSSAESCSSGYPKLLLTNEEKRLLAKEGISLPSSYPLTKQEERELKRIRRKIRNKISAQDSRKRKKEYIDGLEERVKQCSEENHQLIKRIKVLQSQNHDLLSKMKKLQTLLTKTSGKTAQPATCLMILLLSMALVAVPNLNLKLDNKSAISAKDLATAFGESQQSRRNLLFDLKSELEDLEPDPLMYIPNEHDYVENVYKYVSQLSNDIPSSSSPRPAKRSKMLVDYDIDSLDEWELKKRSHEDDENDLIEEMKPNIEELERRLNKSETYESLSESDRLLVQSIINVAASAGLQKSTTL